MAPDNAPGASHPGGTPPSPGRRRACVAPCLLLLVLSQCAILGLLFCARTGRLDGRFLPGMGLGIGIDLSPLLGAGYAAARGRNDHHSGHAQHRGPGRLQTPTDSDHQKYGVPQEQTPGVSGATGGTHVESTRTQEERLLASAASGASAEGLTSPHSVDAMPQSQTSQPAASQSQSQSQPQSQARPQSEPQLQPQSADEPAEGANRAGEGSEGNTAVAAQGRAHQEGGHTKATAGTPDGEAWAPQRAWTNHSALGFASFSAYQVNPFHFVVLGHSLYPSEIQRLEGAAPKQLGCTWAHNGRETQGSLSSMWLELETAFGRFDYTLLILVCRLSGRPRARWQPFSLLSNARGGAGKSGGGGGREKERRRQGQRGKASKKKGKLSGLKNGLGQAWSKLKWTLLPSGQRSSRNTNQRGRSLAAGLQPQEALEQVLGPGTPRAAQPHLLSSWPADSTDRGRRRALAQAQTWMARSTDRSRRWGEGAKEGLQQAQEVGEAGVPGAARRRLHSMGQSPGQKQVQVQGQGQRQGQGQGQGQGQSAGVLRLSFGRYAFSMHPETFQQGGAKGKKDKGKAKGRKGEGRRFLTFCGPPMYGPMHPQSVFQWLVYHQRTLGFDHAFLYNVTAVSPAMARLLRPYLDAGLVSVTDFSGVLQYSSLSGGLFTAVNDCLHRNRGTADWVVYMDFDEYFVVKSLGGGVRPAGSVRQFLRTRMEGHSHLSHGAYNFALVADEPPWEASEKKLAVELMRLHDASPYCLTRRFKPQVCPRHYGYRKMIVDPMRVCLVHIHHVDTRQTKRLHCPGPKDKLLSTREVYHGHFRGMTTHPINVTGPETMAFVRRKHLVPSVDVAYAAAKAREQCLSPTGLKKECALPAHEP